MSGQRPPGVRVERFMRSLLPLGVVYAVLVAIEVGATVMDTAAVTALRVITILVHASTAVVLISSGILWRRERRGGGA